MVEWQGFKFKFDLTTREAIAEQWRDSGQSDEPPKESETAPLLPMKVPEAPPIKRCDDCKVIEVSNTQIICDACKIERRRKWESMSTPKKDSHAYYQHSFSSKL